VDYVFDLDANLASYSLVDGSYLVEFAIGYELDMNTVVYSQVILVRGQSYLHTELGEVYDLQFGIREKLADDDNVKTCIDFSYISTRRFIPKVHRWVVFNRILLCLEELIREKKPAYVTMETYHPHVPPQAMGKYDRIVERLDALGYDLRERFRGPHSRFHGTEEGIDYWYFRRRLTGSSRRIDLMERLRRYLRRAMHAALEKVP
jgi:hypothetical protein